MHVKTHISASSQSNVAHTHTHIAQCLRQALDQVSHLRKKKKFPVRDILVIFFSSSVSLSLMGADRTGTATLNVRRPSTYESKLCCTISLFSDPVSGRFKIHVKSSGGTVFRDSALLRDLQRNVKTEEEEDADRC